MFRHFLVSLVEWSRRHAALVLILALVLTAASAGIAWFRLGVDTDTGKLISSSLDWRKSATEFDAAFPESKDQTVIVLDGKSPDAVAAATSKLAAVLAADKTLFKSVDTPDSGPFFAKYGLLFLSVDDLTQLSNQLAKAQPLLGPLSQDPSLRGLFGVLDQALTGYEQGEAPGDFLSRPFGSIADTVHSVVTGHPVPLDWSQLMTDKPPRPEELRHFILVQARLDYTRVQPGSPASDAIRAAAKDLGLDKMGVRIRLTGSVPLEDDEFASVSEGAGEATALSFAAVLVILFAGLRAPRLIVAITITLIVGLIVTAAFATLAVGTLNLISIAFAVLFIGIGVDFGIQFSMRYRANLFEVMGPSKDHAGPAEDWRALNAAALERTAHAVTGPLGIAALATCVGFFSFLPTDYKGVSELGLIAGTSMLIALAANLTLLPALLTLWPARGRPESAGFEWARPADKWLMRHARSVLIGAGLCGLLALGSIPWVHFDADPLDLRDPRMESVSTALELTNDPLTTPYTADLLAPNEEAAEQTAIRLAKLPLVKYVLTLASLVPEDQQRKLEILDQTRFLLGPVIDNLGTLPKPSITEDRAALGKFTAHLHQILSGPKGGGLEPAGQKLARALDQFLEVSGGGGIVLLTRTLLSGLEGRLDTLRTAMQAGPLTVATMPREIKDDWISADGRARLSIVPKDNVHDPRALARFVDLLRENAPGVTGAPVTILESGRTVSRAFVTASVVAVAAITLVLALILRSLRDVLLVLIPLLLAGLLSLGSCVILHLSFNYANVIAVPLLMGIGVAFDIYFVMAWRQRGGIANPHSAELLHSATARAVVFSAFTTSSAFGSLVLSPHRGMASMGQLLLMTLGWVLLSTLIVQPALMKWWAGRDAARGA